MKINIQIPANSKRTRILAGFMAFLIFALTFQEAFVGWNFGITVKATTPTPGDGLITATSTASKYMGQSGYTTSVESAYTYTGKVKPVTVNMYDYLTNAEVTGTWNSLNDSSYTWHADYQPYGTFNSAVSNDTLSPEIVLSPAEDNITIKYESTWFSSSENVYIHLYNGNTNNGWPGERMTYNSNTSTFEYTVKASDLSFSPKGVVFNGGSDAKKTDKVDLSATMSANHTFIFRDGIDQNIVFKFRGNWQPTDLHIHIWDGEGGLTTYPGYEMSYDYWYNNNYYYTTGTVNPARVPNAYKMSWSGGDSGDKSYSSFARGYTYIIDGSNRDVVESYQHVSYDADSSGEGAQDITTNHYVTPLYFGLFLDTSSTPNYNNYWWQPNLAQRTSGLANTAVQKLVDNQLTNGKLTQNAVELPYFSSSWANSHKDNNKDIMKYWESTDTSKISFPFYEVMTSTSKSEGYVAGTNHSITEKARYYQFNSKDSTVYFNASNRQFEEKNPSTERIRDTYGNSGFFPYNNNNDSYVGSDNPKSGKNNNYGFGAKFEMTFKLNSDGKVYTVDEDGNSIDGAGKVNTRFEFTGDDDLWVFIDGNLVLDMGGSHSASEGYIDFAQKKAVAETAITLGAGSGKDDIYITTATVEQKKVENAAFTSLIDDYDPTTGYEPSTVHTMTIFYMERGMSESNLKIRYNFPVESNFSKMKVKEQTNFSNVNDGLKDVAQKAAEYDVFQYTVKNQGTDRNHVLQSTTKYPTAVDYVRTVQGINTKLASQTSTGTTSYYFQPANTSTNYNVSNVSYNWVDEYAGMASSNGVGGQTDASGQLYLLHGTPSSSGVSEVKSSAEFEGQFDRYSLMQISQGSQLYTPNEHTDSSSASAALLNGTSTRAVSDYYTTERSIFSTTSSTPISIGDNVQFTFRNDIDSTNLTLGSSTPDANLSSAVQMTELFVNTVKTGTLNITKKVTGETLNTNYTFKLKLQKVFGGSDSVSDYTAIEALKGVMNEGVISGTPTVNLITNGTGEGTFTLQAGQTLSISGIPYGTKYIVTEDTTGLSQTPQTITGQVEDSDNKTINSESFDVEITNEYPSRSEERRVG